MSIRSVTAKDFLTVRRSRALWAAGTLLALLMAFIAYGYTGYQLSATEAVQDLFGALVLALGVLLPIVGLVASYLAIAGERQSGGIKFLLSFPNTRRDVFLGKLASRLALVAALVGFMFLTAASVAAAKHGTLPVGTALGLFALSVVYASVFVCIAIALSAAIATRSRAIAASVGAYFVLVILYIVPGVRITAVVQWVHHTMLGFEQSQNLYDAVSYTSPYIAYQKAANLVLPAAQRSQVFYRSPDAGDLPGYLANEVSLVVFAVWLIVPLVLGYLRFDRADLD